jgi:hypothetical protein
MNNICKIIYTISSITFPKICPPDLIQKVITLFTLHITSKNKIHAIDKSIKQNINDTMRPLRIFDLLIPSDTAYEAKAKIFRSSNIKSTFGFFSIPVLNKALAEKSFFKILKRYDSGLIIGDLLHFSIWYLTKKSSIINWYSKRATLMPLIIRTPVWSALAVIKIIHIILLRLWTKIAKSNYSQRTEITQMNQGEFVLDVLKKAEEKNWSVLSLHLDPLADAVTEKLINKLYPRLNYHTWDYSIRSIVPPIEPDYEHLHPLYAKHPLYWELRNYIVHHPHDLILLSTHDDDMEYLFFDAIRKDKEITFKTGMITTLSGISSQNVSGKVSLFTGIKFLISIILTQFVNELDVESIPAKHIKLNLKTQNNNFIKYYNGEKIEVNVGIMENWNEAVARVLSGIHPDGKLFEVLGTPTKYIGPQVKSTYNAIRDSAYQSGRYDELVVELLYNGELFAINPGFAVFDMHDNIVLTGTVEQVNSYA